MAFIPANNVAKATIVFNAPSGLIENIHYFHKATGLTGTDLSDLVTAIDTWVTDAMLPLLTQETRHVQTRVQDVSLANLLPVDIFHSTGHTGANVTTSIPPSAPCCVTKRTGKVGRSYRGRTYLSGFPVGNLGTAGGINSTLQTAILSAMASFIGDALVSGLVSSVVSYFSGVDSLHKPIARTSGVATPVTAVTMDTSIDSQRRRGVGRGI